MNDLDLSGYSFFGVIHFYKNHAHAHIFKRQNLNKNPPNKLTDKD